MYIKLLELIIFLWKIYIYDGNVISTYESKCKVSEENIADNSDVMISKSKEELKDINIKKIQSGKTVLIGEFDDTIQVKLDGGNYAELVREGNKYSIKALKGMGYVKLTITNNKEIKLKTY